jgi:hypothetical protein
MQREFASEEQRAHTMIARLELVSHGTVAKLGGAGGGSGDGPLFPPGGVVSKEDREEDHPHKSHLVFRRLLARCDTEPQFARLADDAEEVLRQWQHSARPPRDSQAWREQVGRAMGSIRDVAADWGISPTYAHQLRRQYGRSAA